MFPLAVFSALHKYEAKQLGGSLSVYMATIMTSTCEDSTVFCGHVTTWNRQQILCFYLAAYLDRGSIWSVWNTTQDRTGHSHWLFEQPNIVLLKWHFLGSSRDGATQLTLAWYRLRLWYHGWLENLKLQTEVGFYYTALKCNPCCGPEGERDILTLPVTWSSTGSKA